MWEVKVRRLLGSMWAAESGFLPPSYADRENIFVNSRLAAECGIFTICL